MKRRVLLASMAALGGMVIAPQAGARAEAGRYPRLPPLKGRLKQGLTPHLFEGTIEETCRMAVALGIRGLDFVSNPADWPVVKKHGLAVPVLRVDFGGGISTPGRAPDGPPGWNAIAVPDTGGAFAAALRDRIDAAAENGIPNIIVTCGTRAALGYDEGKRNAIRFLEQIRTHAQSRGVTLVLENINSGFPGGPPEPPGSMFDHLAWGLDIVRQLDSPHVKLLMDLYHAQLMDGNIVHFIRKNIRWIGHFHTGGVPGRHEIDETQELNYRFIAEAIAELGYGGFISHEWTPAPGQDKFRSIRKCMEIIDA
ncbi:TIM barrel protein [Pseudoduganella dura]|nr:TIM barrel protein [Pseudoduganella dura]